MSGWRRARSIWLGVGLLTAGIACQGQFETPELGARDGTGGRAQAQRGSERTESAGRSSEVDTQGGGGSSSVPSSPDAGSPGAPVAVDAGAVVVAPERIYCDAHAVVFRETCGNGSCHTNRGATIGDFAVGPAEAARYVGRSSVRNVNCGLIIDPDEPQNSLILTKVTGEYPVDLPCGGPMPVGSIAITDEQIDCIADWVEQFQR